MPHLVYTDDGYEPTTKLDSTLEVYVFGVPRELGLVDVSHRTGISIKGKQLALPSGQGDVIVVDKVPSGFTSFEDDDGILFALRRDNQIWLLADLIHGVQSGGSSSLDPFIEILNMVIEGVTPITPEERRKIYEERLRQYIINKSLESIKYITDNYNVHMNNVKSQERTFQDSLKNMYSWKKMKESAKTLDSKEASQVLNDLYALPFIKDITFNSRCIVVTTKPITLGPFDYGCWTFELTSNEPRITPEKVDIESRHPYAYSDPGHFCLGGFNEAYVMATEGCDYVKAVSILKMLITNYMVTTKMSYLEPFLKKTMGTKEYNSALNEVLNLAGLKKSECDKVEISSILGNEVTLVGSLNSGAAFRKVVKI